MRNLKLGDVSEKTVELAGNPLHLCCGFDAAEESAVMYSCDHNLKLSKQYLGKDGLCWREALPDGAPLDARVVNMTHLPLPCNVCVGLSSGEIWIIGGTDGSCVDSGICGGGLVAMEWSPDQELVVLVSKDNRMILMSYLLELIAERDLLDEHVGENYFVTVGWGKKETQFHGSEGKAAAKTKVEVTSEDTDIDETPRITWRGDGLFYAVGTVVNGIRRFMIFDKQGEFQYTSEKQVGLEANLAWRPSGNLIATTQKLPNKYIVAFFESNGLKHGEFTIPVNKNTVVQDLSWSSDSEILALKCYDGEEKVYSLLLFTSSNYHWYLKQSLRYKPGQIILKVLWDGDLDQNIDIDPSKKLHVFLDNGKHYYYHWSWNVDHSIGKYSNDDAVVAVIDGNKLLLTAFRHSVVPPPMCAFQIETEFNINVVFFGSTSSSDVWDTNSLCICTDNNELIFYRQTSKKPLKYDMTGAANFEVTFPLQRYNWLWLNENSITCAEYKSGYCIQEFHLYRNADSIKMEQVHSIRLSNQAWSVQPHPNINSKMYILSRSDILEYTLGGNLDEGIQSLRPGNINLRVVNIGDKLYFLLLTHHNMFSVNDARNVLSNVTSMFVQSHFLLLTTHNELVCTELTTSAMEALKDSIKVAESTQIYKRKIERGARLVVASEIRTVFQLPRGNLETIEPRPLSLKVIGEYLDKCEYFNAFDIMRKQRINLNLIYDHDPNKFVQNVDTFLSQTKNPSWLSLFLSDLENVDVTDSMYASSYTYRAPMTSESVNSKVLKVCEIVRKQLEDRNDRDEKILPLLTSYVKQNSIEHLERALTVVKELKLKESNGLKPFIGSDEALRHLLYLVDVNYLYDIALGMYDFDLALLVANKSQKDPKEYVPMLNEFHEMEEHFRNFSINKTLKRFSRAVESLAKCGASRHEELRTFVKYHSLYKDALLLFNPNEEIYQQIAEDYGLHLKLKKQYTEAGFMYQKAGSTDKAIECFQVALEWELAIQLAHSWPKDQFQSLCSDLVDSLKEEKRHDDALTILEQYCDEPLTTIAYAVECGRYVTALRFCRKHVEESTAGSLILPALQEEYTNLMTTVSGNLETFRRHKARLSVVRANKEKLAKGDIIDPDYMHKDSDLYSDVGSTVASTGTRSSSRTFRSSKNRRKHERKLVSLKEGSQYEDVALVSALHTLVSSTFELRRNAKQVNLGLCWFRMDDKALVLQTNLDCLLKDMKECFKEIWTNEFVLEATNATISAQLDTEGVPQGIAALDTHLRIPPIIQDISWKLAGL